MKNLIAKLLLITVVVAGVSNTAMANSRTKGMNSKYKQAEQSLRDTTIFHRKFIKGILIYLMAPLVSPLDIDFPGGGGKSRGSGTKS